MNSDEMFDKGFEDGRHGVASASDDHNYQLGYQNFWIDVAGC